jgi:hypothetical protein
MSDSYFLKLIKQGAQTWNTYREKTFPKILDLSETDFRGISNLNGYDFSRTNLKKACFIDCVIIDANFTQADLSGADFTWAVLWGAQFIQTKLIGTVFYAAELDNAYFEKADLTMAKLNEAKLLKTHFENSTLSDCTIYGISAWGVKLINCYQANLRITLDIDQSITVDNLEVAQFIHLMINSSKIRTIIDTITSKVVLILGRFTPERLAILHIISNHLREANFLPVIFNFEKPASRDISETVSLLAAMSRFIIADITEAKSIPQELMRIVPSFPSVPVLPILHISGSEYGMFEHFKKFNWVKEIYKYETVEDLKKHLTEAIK